MREAALLQKQVRKTQKEPQTSLVTLFPSKEESLILCTFAKQREEEQAKERAKAEQLKQERELVAQKEDAARQARKKVTKVENALTKLSYFRDFISTQSAMT